MIKNETDIQYFSHTQIYSIAVEIKNLLLINSPKNNQTDTYNQYILSKLRTHASNYIPADYTHLRGLYHIKS